MSPVDRRTFLKGAAVAAGATALTGPAFSAALAVEPTAVFQYGVASGDPLPDRVMIWTRVTPSPDATPGSGKGAATKVDWSVRDSVGKVVRRGSLATSATSDHTVKVDVDGLRPDTAYTYSFTTAGRTSPVGRTRTAPALGAANQRLRFGMVSCSNYTGGFFSAYRLLAARDDLDFVVHLGDYLYEYGNGNDRYGPASLAGVRDHDPATEMLSLSDYRRRHAQYKADKDLAALHRRYAFITTWDDHEVADNTWRGGANNHQEATEGPYLARRNRSYQVYDEWMPIRLPQRRSAQETRIYRRLRFGTLADLTMLDLRQYRDIQKPNTDGAAIDAADRTMTGAQQQAFLEQGLTAKGSPTWRLFGNSVQIMPIKSPPLPNAAAAGVAVLQGTPTPVSLPGGGFSLLVDAWDGYTANRRRVLEVAQSSVGDPVFLTGDIHSTWVADLPLDPGTYTGSPTAASPSAGVEFVCTSVTADNLDQITGSPPRTTSIPVEDAILAANRHIKELEFDSHGYSVVDITPERVQFDSFFLSNREDPAATSSFYRGYQSLRGSRTTTRAAAQVPTTRDDRPTAAPASRPTAPSSGAPRAAATPVPVVSSLPSTGGSAVLPALGAAAALAAVSQLRKTAATD